MENELQLKIEEWKQEHGDIYRTPINGSFLIYRQLKRSDYLEITALVMTQEDTDPELETIKKCALNGFDLDVFLKKEGLINSVYELIMKESGFLMLESEKL